LEKSSSAVDIVALSAEGQFSRCVATSAQGFSNLKGSRRPIL